MELFTVQPHKSDSLTVPAAEGMRNRNLSQGFLAAHLSTRATSNWEMCAHDGPFCGPRRLVLERTVWPKFNKKIGLREFFLQASLPFSLPFYLAKPDFARKQILYKRIPVILVNQVLLQPLIWLLIIWFWVRHDEINGDGVFDIELMSVIICLLGYRACIGLKYSFLSDNEYEEFKYAPVEMASQWLENMQLIGTWTEPKLEIFCHEVWLAAKQLNLRIKDLSVYIHEDQNDSFLSYLEITRPQFEKFVDIEPFEDGQGEVSVTQLMVAVCMHSKAPDFNKLVTWWCFGGATIRAFLFGLVREANKKNSFLGETMESAVVVIMSICLIWFYYYTLLRLFTANVIDMNRRLRGAQEVSDLIRVSETKRQDFPQIQMELTDNIQAWVCLRRLIRRIGSRFRKRASVYNSVGNVIFIALLIETMILFFSASDVTSLRRDARFIQSLVDLFFIGSPMIVYIFLGNKVNEQVKVDIEALIAHRIAHRFHSVEKRQAQKRSVSTNGIDQFLMQVEYDDACDDLLDTAIQAMEGMSNNPLSMLGLALDTRLLTSVVTATATILGFILQRVYFANK